MIQDIFPKKFNINYENRTPEAGDFVIVVRNREVLVERQNNDYITFPTVGEVDLLLNGDFLAKKLRFAFAIEEQNTEERYFLCDGADSAWDSVSDSASSAEVKTLLPLDSGNGLPKHYDFAPLNVFRQTWPMYRSYAAVVGYQLLDWYSAHRFCGHCGVETEHAENERMLRCPTCGRTFYPHISPAVIVGVLHEGKILMSKYRGRDYTKFALLAGFAETGESIEDTVHREVMEEVGLKVKNLRFYKSQPWPFSSSLLMGFFCELDGSSERITLEEDELSMAGFYSSDEVPDDDEGISLTSEMMTVFKKSGGVSRVEDLQF